MQSVVYNHLLVSLHGSFLHLCSDKVALGLTRCHLCASLQANLPMILLHATIRMPILSVADSVVLCALLDLVHSNSSHHNSSILCR